LPLVLEGCIPGVIAPMNLLQYQPIKSQLMQAMEYRIAPAFALSYERETIFHDTMDTDFMGIFSSHYQEQLPTIGEAYREYDQFYQLVKDARTVSHEVLSSTLRRVRYDNGYTLLLNYASVPERLPEGVLDGLSYLLIRGE
jgi:hypothetical protein